MADESKIDGAGFKRIRLRLKLSAAVLGRALGYKGSDANIARTIYRLETGRPIRKPIGRLLEMFDAYGVPLAWAGEVAQRKHSERPNWTGPRPASAGYDARHEVSREATARFLANLKPLGPRHGPKVISTVVPAPKAPVAAKQIAEHGLEAISDTATAPHHEPPAERQKCADLDRGPPKPLSRSRRGVPVSPAVIKAIADRAERD